MNTDAPMPAPVPTAVDSATSAEQATLTPVSAEATMLPPPEPAPEKQNLVAPLVSHQGDAADQAKSGSPIKATNKRSFPSPSVPCKASQEEPEHKRVPKHKRVPEKGSANHVSEASPAPARPQQVEKATAMPTPNFGSPQIADDAGGFMFSLDDASDNDDHADDKGQSGFAEPNFGAVSTDFTSTQDFSW
eukprot:TRINITY_DN10491_c0_g1_i1.p2 TRINITY_DN10491_c0_g1~~TRINITY_DN10491_c0_g1_i1.p2  ORF type:complete len:190 (-),score=41.51 TRINITY_DN10491_c0_g1_i1:683-1252(-)